MKKFFALVLVVAVIFCALNIYFKNDGKVKNELTGEVENYLFAGVEKAYYGRKAIPVDDTLEVLVNRGNVTVYGYNEWYSEEGECVVELYGDFKKAPEVTIEEGVLQVSFAESENAEEIQVDLYIADSRAYEKVDVILGSGNLYFNGLTNTSEITLVNQNGDVSLGFVGYMGLTEVDVNAERCSMDVDTENITEICWQRYCNVCEHSYIFDTSKHDGSGSVFCDHEDPGKRFYERTFSQNEAECQLNIFGTTVSLYGY